MKEIGQEKKQLFRYHIERNIERRNTNNIFQLRSNRWRLSTFDRFKLGNMLKFGGPLIFSFTTIFIFGRTNLNLRASIPHQEQRRPLTNAS